MGLGAGELALILVIAYVVVGPEDMVKLSRTLARTLRQLRKLTVDLDAEGSVTSDLDGVLKEIQKAEEQFREKTN